MPYRKLALALALLLLPFGTAPLAAQFVRDTANVPTAGVGFTEQVEFADVDGDGDWDVAIADGGDTGNQQNRIWINQGGLQGGSLGTFLDETSTRMPAVLDASRDVEFADIDLDGDSDLFVANHSSFNNQPSRILVNMGGAQGGTAGFFQDQTAQRWINLGGPGSSIAPSLVLGSGGWIDWISDGDFGDLDMDGDPDLIPSSVSAQHAGVVPTRMFLNDGNGAFAEYNPSGIQLTGSAIPNGTPGLWCEGLQQQNTQNTTGAFCDIAATAIDSDLGDLDGDFDLDLWLGDRQSKPRVHTNQSARAGSLQPWRDTTWLSLPANSAVGQGKYEQELGDLDNDLDLDLYGLNYLGQSFSFKDTTAVNDGAAHFSAETEVPSSTSDDEEVDFLDFDADGDLDVMVANFSGQDRLYRNAPTSSGPVLSLVVGGLPVDSTTSRDLDTADLNGDGACDAMVANDVNQPEWYLRNTSGVADTTASRVVLEQLGWRRAGSAPSVVRAAVYGNAADYTTGYDATSLEYSLDGGPFTSAPMTHAGAQLFRGTIPGNLVGQVDYRVRTTDPQGNVGLSVTHRFVASPANCSGSIQPFCTPTPSSIGCVPALEWVGVPRASGSSGFLLRCTQLPNRQGAILIYGFGGQASIPFLGGTLCVGGTLHAGPRVFTAGSPPPTIDCTGNVSFDMNAYAAGLLGGTPHAALSVPGTQVVCQWLVRDRGSPPPNSAAMSAGLQYTVCP